MFIFQAASFSFAMLGRSECLLSNLEIQLPIKFALLKNNNLFRWFNFGQFQPSVKLNREKVAVYCLPEPGTFLQHFLWEKKKLTVEMFLTSARER